MPEDSTPNQRSTPAATSPSLVEDASARLVTRLLALGWRHRGRCLVTLAWSIAVQALLLGGFIFGGLALDVLRHHARPENAPEPRWPLLGPGGLADLGLTGQVVLAAGLVLGFTLVRSVAQYQARVTGESLIQAIIVDLRTTLYDKLQRMHFRYFDEQDAGGLINRVTADAQSVRMFIQGVVVRLVIAAASLVLFLGYMLAEHVLLTLAVLVVLPFQIVVMQRYTRLVRARFRAQRESMDRLVQHLQESITGIKVVKGFGQESAMRDRFAARNDEAVAKRMSIVEATSAHMPAIPASGFLQMAVLLGYGGYLVHRGPELDGIMLGTLWVFLSLLRRLAEQIDAIVQTASSLPDALTGAERVFELLDAPPEIISPGATAAAATSPAEADDGRGIEGRITFEDVTFRYGGPDAPVVLHDIRLDIAPGERVALVGPAGAGKSTLLSLVPRFHDPAAGRVLVDGRDVREWDLRMLRRSVGFVFQEPFLFSNTIAANVAFGLGHGGERDRERILAAIDDAAAREFVDEAADRLDTIVGERGLNLSGGERQRLSLARALILEPPILLLDDTMASVDARTEMRIQAALDRLMAGRTTLIIAHRMSTLRSVDRIVVLERGRITAEGSHEHLMRVNTHYRETVRIQTEHARAEEEEGAA